MARQKLGVGLTFPDSSNLDSTKPFDITHGQPGMWAVPNEAYSVSGQNITGQVSTTQGTVWALRFMPTRDMTIIKIGFSVFSIATNNDQVDVGIYDATGARIVRAGATSGIVNSSTGPKKISISSTVITMGTIYYAAFWYGPSSGVSQAGINTVDAGTGNRTQMFGTTAGSLEVTQMFENVTGGLPSTLSMNAGAGSGPALALLEV